MALVIAEFLGVIGVDFVPSQNLAELIPYLLTVFIGVFLVAAVFRLVGGMARSLFVGRRF